MKKGKRMLESDIAKDRETARQQGLRYYRGADCSWGNHAPIRYQSDGSCVECQKLNAHSRKLEDRQRDKQERKAWRLENADKVKAQNARAYARRKAAASTPSFSIVDALFSDD